MHFIANKKIKDQNQQVEHVEDDYYQQAEKIEVGDWIEFVEKKYANKRKRHFVGDNDILESSDGVKFVVTTEWSINTIYNIVELAKKEGFQIDEA